VESGHAPEKKILANWTRSGSPAAIARLHSLDELCAPADMRFRPRQVSEVDPALLLIPTTSRRKKQKRRSSRLRSRSLAPVRVARPQPVT